MNLQNEDRTKTKCLTRYPKFLYIRRGDVTPNEAYFIDRKNDQNRDLSENDYGKDHLYSNNIENYNLLNVPLNKYTTTLYEPHNHFTRVSSESVCSRHLHTESKYTPGASEPNFSEHLTKKKFCMHPNETFSLSSDQISKKLPERLYGKVCSDKTTYCRPVLNLYNQEFLYRTMVKNAKLRRLVTELANAREKEKNKEHWNNYINDLRRKHYGDAKVKLASSLHNISDEYEIHDTIEDIYNTKFTCKQSKPCQSLLQDFYDPNDTKVSNNYSSIASCECVQKPISYHPYRTNLLCFPTSSQGRLIMLERERIKRSPNRTYKPLFKTINEEKKIDRECLKSVRGRESLYDSKTNYIVRNSRSTNTALESTSTQTYFQEICVKSVEVPKSKGCNTNHVVNEKECAKEMRNKGTGPDTFHDTNLKKNPLVSIEEKLDNLIYSINNFIIEMNTKSDQYKTFHRHTKPGKRNVKYTRSDICNMARKEKILCGIVDDSSRTTGNTSIDNFNGVQTIDENLTKINDILLKGIGKNEFITLKRSSVGETYPCSVQISITIPTREISTEVTRSLSKAANIDNHNNITVEELPKPEMRRMAIAVNTDPLSLLAMLRVSTEETIRKLLSYVPNIDYYSYLSRLQGASHGDVESQYVCNICGASFIKASALTDHIQKHELGITRDCCVCRHVLDLPRRRPALFKCPHCGQRFTRAYCCELHQEACAKRMGRLHDVPSSLVLLR